MWQINCHTGHSQNTRPEWAGINLIIVALIAFIGIYISIAYITAPDQYSHWLPHNHQTDIFAKQIIITPQIPHTPDNDAGIQTGLTPHPGLLIKLTPSSSQQESTYCTMGIPVIVRGKTYTVNGYTTASHCINHELSFHSRKTADVFLSKPPAVTHTITTYPSSSSPDFDKFILWGKGYSKIGHHRDRIPHSPDSLIRQNGYALIDPSWRGYDFLSGIVVNNDHQAQPQPIIANTWPIVGVVSHLQYDQLHAGLPLCIDAATTGVTCGHLIAIQCTKISNNTPGPIDSKTCTSPALYLDIPTKSEDAGAPVFMITDHQQAILLGTITPSYPLGHYSPDFLHAIHNNTHLLNNINADTSSPPMNNDRSSPMEISMAVLLEPELARLHAQAIITANQAGFFTPAQGYSTLTTTQER